MMLMIRVSTPKITVETMLWSFNLSIVPGVAKPSKGCGNGIARR